MLQGEITPPADKSITHRAFLFSVLSGGESVIKARAIGRDNLASLRVAQQLGAEVSAQFDEVTAALALEEGLVGSSTTDEYSTIKVKGCAAELSQPLAALDCGNSGTTARLLCGLLAGQKIQVELIGDESLSARPFRRVTEPLEEMGARFSGDMLPIRVEGAPLRAISFHSPRASAQVKTALLLAGLQAEGETKLTEPSLSRDHSERMLRSMGALLEQDRRLDGRFESRISKRVAPLSPLDMQIPGDLSSAAFFIVAASVSPSSKVTLRGVSLNPTRLGILTVMRRMGAKISEHNLRDEGGEPIADLEIESADLSGIEIGREDTLLAIDEIPILAVSAACSKGETVIKGAEELRVKESDRLSMVASLLRSFSVEVEEFPDGLCIQGGAALVFRPELAGSWLNCHDHRILMSGSILRFLATGIVSIDKPEIIETSYPEFIKHFQRLAQRS